MFWSSVLGRVKPKSLFAFLPRPGALAAGLVGRLPSVARGEGTGCGRPQAGGQLVALGGSVQQWRGMAGSNARHKKILKLAKGYRGRHKNVFKIAIQKVEMGLQMAYRDRKNKRREFKRLWIARINAGVRQHGLAYSRFIHQAKVANVQLNRKVLSDMAVTEPYSFRAVVETVKAKGGSPPPPDGAGKPLDFDEGAIVDLSELEDEAALEEDEAALEEDGIEDALEGAADLDKVGEFGWDEWEQLDRGDGENEDTPSSASSSLSSSGEDGGEAENKKDP